MIAVAVRPEFHHVNVAIVVVLCSKVFDPGQRIAFGMALLDIVENELAVRRVHRQMLDLMTPVVVII